MGSERHDGVTRFGASTVCPRVTIEMPEQKTGSRRRWTSILTVGMAIVIAGCAGSDASDGSDASRSTMRTDPPETTAPEVTVDPDDASAGEGSTQATETDRVAPHGVILDYSPTLSDVSTLLYLTQHPDIELLAVTLAGTGESHCEAGVSHTIGLLELAGLPDVPVACGRTTPIGPGNEWPPEWRERSDALDGLDLPDGLRGVDLDAADLLASVAAAEEDPVTIIAVGPLTNVAAALGGHPDLPQDVAHIVTMGGAFDVAGNARNDLAEWNYYIDPTAVEIAFDSGIPITVVPLDATNDVPVTREWFDRLTRHHTTAAATAVHDLLSATPGWELGFSFWDELAAAVVVDPTLVTFEDRAIVVVTTGDEMGRTRPDDDGVAVRVAIRPDTERFERELLTGLNAGVDEPDPVGATPQERTYFEAVGESRRTVDDGIGRLFRSPEASAVDEVMSADESTPLTSEQERILRVFIDQFWRTGIDLIEVHAAELAELDVPTSLRPSHDAYVGALDALVAGESERLRTLDALHGEALRSFLWTTDDEIDRVQTTCEELELQAVVRDVDVVLCPA